MRRVSLLGLSPITLLALTLSARAADPVKGRPIELSVDATEAPRKLLHARLVIPAAPGLLTLYYPKWIPGEHSPSGPINDLSGLRLRAGGKPLAWRRDDVDLYAFHCTVPDGADSVEATLEYLASAVKEGYTSGASMTPQLAVLNWNQVLVYPKGRPVREQQVHASLTLPRGWKLGTALPIDTTKDALTQFKPVSLEMLVDSPVLCGAHLKEVPLASSSGPPHFLILAADHPKSLELAPALKEQYERLVAEAGSMFGARHYRSYRFLVTMSEFVRPDGIEHHECSDNRLPERFLLDDSYRKQWYAWLLPHEYVHSWNGKYRRPDGLATPDFQEPMKTRLLWVYEGLTQYLGHVLAARSGLFGPEVSRENLALIADWARNQHGRTWRPLEDTATAAPFLYGARSDWASRRRGVDFYDEGSLLWLDVDTLIREKTDGKKSLDDFCRAFFGGKDAPPEVKPYTFDDLLRALNDVVVHDWKGFFEKRLTTTGAEPPLDGLKRSGWKVVHGDTAGELLKARDGDDKTINLTSSIGLLLKDDGQVQDVIPGQAADKAGIGPGMKLLGINDRRWSAERLHQAVEATRDGKEKLVLLMENQDYFKTVALDYAEGEKYPILKRLDGKPDVLSDIFRPRGDETISPKDGVIRLFNGKDLTGLYTWLKDTKREDPRKVFTVEDGVLHISGDGFGYVATEKTYRDYHLIVEYRWGKKTDGGKFVRNSGILLHGVGPDGGANGTWMSTIECQLAQGCVGDLIVIRGKDEKQEVIPVQLTSDVVLGPDKRPRWKKGGAARVFTRGQLWWSLHDPDYKELLDTRGKNDVESPLGEWTRVECLCDGKRITVVVNGTTVNECYDVFPAAGKIQLQCEGFELFVRKFELHPLKK